MPIAAVNGVRLNYLQMAAEDVVAREDLVMVHGLATNMAFWYFHYAPVFAKRFRVTLYDLRGHGRSDMPGTGYQPCELAHDLAALLDLLEIKRAHFLAHSFGGVVAMNLACLQPGRLLSLVLADSHISAVRHTETPHEWIHGQSIQPVLDRHHLELDTRDPYFGYKLLTRVAQLQLRNVEVPAELLELVGPMMGTNGPRTAARWLRLMDTTRAASDTMGDDGLSLEQLRKFAFPILAMYGDNSQARLTGSELLQVWPHAEFQRVRDAGHFFPTSRPEEVIAGCQRFWGNESAKLPRRHRAGETRRSYFRSDRVFRSDGSWYFTTREMHRVGPFAEPDEARENLTRYISAIAPA